MSLAPPTVAQLAGFTGKQSSEFNTFASQALAQATLLFSIATGLNSYPQDDSLSQLAYNGILDMADKIYLTQPYREASASPYQSETIGSYSYSRATNSVKKGEDTGVLWFDLAVSKLKSADTSIGASGSIQGFEWDGVEIMPNGKTRIVGANGPRPDGHISWEIDTGIIHDHLN